MPRALTKGGTEVNRRNQGFSLLEVALILLLMGIVGVAAIPSMQSIRRQEVRKFASEMCLDLVTQRSKERVNPGEGYQLVLSNSDGSGAPYYGYTLQRILPSGGTEEIKSNYCISHSLEISIRDKDGNIPATAINKLIFKDNQLKADGSGDVYSVLTIDLVNDKSKLEILYWNETGHYEIK